MTACGLTGRVAGRYVEVGCPTFDSKFDVLDDLASYYATRSPAVCKLAAEVRAGGTDGPALHRVMQARLRFRPEREETYRTPDETLALGGDCDDHVLAGLAIARRLGLPARMLGRPGRGKVEGHAALQLQRRGNVRDWFWAETTVPAAWGEAPDDAAARLGLGRSDLGGQSATGAPLALTIAPAILEALRASGVATTDEASATLVDPNGPAGRRTYGEIAGYLYTTATTRPDIRAGLSAASLAYQQIREGQRDGAIEVLRTQIEGVQAQVTDLISTMADAAYVDIAQEVVGAIPVLGTVVNLAIDIGQAVGLSSGPDTTDAERLAECMGRVVSPTPSGAGGQVMPADICRPETTIGRYLQFFEMDPNTVSPLSSNGKTWAEYFGGRSMAKLYKYGRATADDQQRALDAWIAKRGTVETAIGNLYFWRVPSDVRELLRLARTAIASQYRPPVTAAQYAGGARSRPLGSGGSELWPLYCDLLLQQLTLARVSWPAFRVVATERDSCAPWTNTAEAPIKLLNAYASSLASQYADPLAKVSLDGEVRATARTAMVRSAGGGAGGPFVLRSDLVAASIASAGPSKGQQAATAVGLGAVTVGAVLALLKWGPKWR